MEGKIQKTAAFKTSDGCIFENLEEARSHQAQISLRAVIRSTDLLKNEIQDRDDVENDVIHSLVKHRKQLMEALQSCELSIHIGNALRKNDNEQT